MRLSNKLITLIIATIITINIPVVSFAQESNRDRVILESSSIRKELRSKYKIELDSKVRDSKIPYEVYIKLSEFNASSLEKILIKAGEARKEKVIIKTDAVEYSEANKKSISEHFSNAVEKAGSLYYPASTHNMLTTFNNRYTKIEIDINYDMTLEEDIVVRNWVKSKVASFASTKTGKELQIAQMKYITEVISKSLEYDQTLSNYSAYEGITTGVTVCNGYSWLTKYFLDEFKIENKLQTGIYNDSSLQDGDTNHIWNKVKLDGVWYNIDNTANDPVFLNGGKDQNYVSYDFFLKEDSYMLNNGYRW